MSSHSTCRTPKKRLRPRRFCRPRSRLGMLRMFARLIWPTLFCLLRRQRWRTDWSTLCNTAASAPFSAQQRTCIASGSTAARGTKRHVHIAPLRALNEQVSWFLLLSCSLHALSSVLALFCVVRAEQRRVDARRREPSYSLIQ